MSSEAAVERWLDALDGRHFANLTQSEVTRALRALSSCYVERREKLASGGALDGAGKRAAFALFYGAQHFVITREIVRALEIRAARIVDLGCGTGTAGAAVAVESGAQIDGYDLNPWAVAEANWTYRALGVHGRARVDNIRNVQIKGSAGWLVLAAYAINELAEDVRAPILQRLIDAHARGSSVLVIEPIGRRVNLWWPQWRSVFADTGGRENEWRFHAALPTTQRALAKGAGLDVQVLTAKSLWLPGTAGGAAIR